MLRFYAGFSPSLNDDSLELHDQSLILKLGLQIPENWDWYQRMNVGWHRGGVRETVPLGARTDWLRIASFPIRVRSRAVDGVERPIRTSLIKAYGRPLIYNHLDSEMKQEHGKVFGLLPRQINYPRNGLDEIVYVPEGDLSRLVKIIKAPEVLSSTIERFANDIARSLEVIRECVRDRSPSTE